MRSVVGEQHRVDVDSARLRDCSVEREPQALLLTEDLDAAPARQSIAPVERNV